MDRSGSENRMSGERSGAGLEKYGGAGNKRERSGGRAESAAHNPLKRRPNN